MNIQIAATTSSNGHHGITSENTKNWSIGIDTTKRTVDSTIQREVRYVGIPNISNKFVTNDGKLRYKCINSIISKDTLRSGVISNRGNIYSGVFSIPI